MKVDILLSGAGGQGLMSLGKLIAKAAILENKFSTYIPSYGAEVRGGTAYCYVKISDNPIASPLVEVADVAIILNQQSLDKFKGQLNRKCILILNSDRIPVKPELPIEKVMYLPLNKAAIDCGDIRSANMVALGALLSLKPDMLSEEAIVEVLRGIFGSNAAVGVNIKALSKGREMAGISKS